MATVSYSDLETLCGEVLPPRIALSIVDISYVRNSYTTNDFPTSGGSDSGSGSGHTVAYACQENATPSSNSGLLGLFSSPGANTVQCTPAAVSGS